MFKVFTILLFLTSQFSMASNVIKIGAYEFKPYFFENSNESLLVQIVSVLNKEMPEYKFEIQTLPAKRRFQYFSENKVDFMIFEDQNWGWKKINHLFHNLGIEDGELFFGHNQKINNENYFKIFTKKSIVGILGYHYQITNFEEEPSKKYDFKFITVSNAENVMDVILKQRADIGILPKSYLSRYFEKHPAVENQLILSSNFDQKYKLGLISQPKSKISSEKLTKILNILRSNPEVISLYRQFALLK